MEKITINNLRTLCTHINRMTGNNLNAWDKETGTHNPGTYEVEAGSNAYGRSWKLTQITNKDGGLTIILYAENARDLYNRMHAYIDGWNAAKYPRKFD